MSDQHRPRWAERIQAEREAREWGKWEMSRRLLNTVGIEPTPGRLKSLGRQMLEREKGRHFPRDWTDAYATVLGVQREKLFAFEEAAASPVGTVEESPTPDTGDDDVKRRAALQILAALSAGAAIPPGALEEVLAGIEHPLSGGEADLDAWEQAVHDHSYQLVHTDAGVLVPALTADIIAVGEQLRRGVPPRTQIGLLRISAALSGLLADALGQVGDGRAARRAWDAARRAADATEDRGLRVWARGRAAQISAYDRSPRVVNGLVDEATAIAGQSPSPGLARAHAARAYLAARQGDRPVALKSMDQLKNVFERLPHAADPTPLEFSESHLRWSEAYVHGLFGNGKAATAAADDADALYPANAYAPRTNLDMIRAAVAIQDHDLAGLDLALAALDGRPRPMYATRTLALRIVHGLPTTRARTLPAARELRALTTTA